MLQSKMILLQRYNSFVKKADLIGWTCSPRYKMLGLESCRRPLFGAFWDPHLVLSWGWSNLSIPRQFILKTRILNLSSSTEGKGKSFFSPRKATYMFCSYRRWPKTNHWWNFGDKNKLFFFATRATHSATSTLNYGVLEQWRNEGKALVQSIMQFSR